MVEMKWVSVNVQHIERIHSRGQSDSELDVTNLKNNMRLMNLSMLFVVYIAQHRREREEGR